MVATTQVGRVRDGAQLSRLLNDTRRNAADVGGPGGHRDRQAGPPEANLASNQASQGPARRQSVPTSQHTHTHASQSGTVVVVFISVLNIVTYKKISNKCKILQLV